MGGVLGIRYGVLACFGVKWKDRHCSYSIAQDGSVALGHAYAWAAESFFIARDTGECQTSQAGLITL
jgi:hypothetical protein